MIGGRNFDHWNIVGRLKNETVEQHRALENLLAIDQPDLPLQRYRRILQLLHGFYVPWEQRYFPALRQCYPALQEEREKSSRLESDLRFFGIDSATMTLCTFVPDLRSTPQILGSMYVLEGATLGGQIVSRMLERTFSLSNGKGYSFFKGYGPETGPMWRSFQDVLILNSTPATEPVVVKAAQKTFSALHTWMAEGLRG